MGATLYRSNNTNKLSPQEPVGRRYRRWLGSNNTNKLSPQERYTWSRSCTCVQIIQINLVLKNFLLLLRISPVVQIIQINLVLKNVLHTRTHEDLVQIIQINLVLKNCQPYYSIFMLYLQYILSISIIKCQIKSCVFIFKLFH